MAPRWTDYGASLARFPAFYPRDQGFDTPSLHKRPTTFSVLASVEASWPQRVLAENSTSALRHLQKASAFCRQAFGLAYPLHDCITVKDS